MEAEQAQQIVRALAQGIDPHTGETYAGDSPYQHPQTVRALYHALDAMQQPGQARRKQLPENAGKSWSPEDDQLLGAGFDAGKDTKQLAVEHKRTEWAVKTRLAKMGKIELEGGRQQR
jgi:hypothetical protein